MNDTAAMSCGEVSAPLLPSPDAPSPAPGDGFGAADGALAERIHRRNAREAGVEMGTGEGKRVRDDVRDGAAVAAFSLLASTALAVVLTLCTRLG